VNSSSIKWMLNHVPPVFLRHVLQMRKDWRFAATKIAALPKSELPKDTVRRYLAAREFAPGNTLCYAPENSMYFARNGNIQACCFNRDVPLGRYPEQSIQEVWQGPRRVSLRQRIKCHDLHGGCQLCKKSLLEGAPEQVPARQYDYAAQRHPAWPTRMDFELDNACNLECVMCSGEFSSTIRIKIIY